jgi:hypothetical protein
MSSLLPFVVALGLVAPAQTESPFEAGLQLRYQGSVSRVAGGEAGPTLKSVTLRFLVTQGKSGEGFQLAFLVSERGSGAWSWPERFGRIAVDRGNAALGGKAGPSAMFDYQGTPTALSLPLPVFSHSEALQPGVRWTADGFEHRVTGREQRADRDCWKIEVANRLGAKRLLWVEAGTDLVVATEQSIFMGQGDEHRLAMALVESRQLPPEELARETAPLDFLMAIQGKLRRGEVTKPEDLTADQIEEVSRSLDEIERLAEKTHTRSLAAAIARDVKEARQRNDQVSQLRTRLVGKAAPEFSIETLDRRTFGSGHLNRKITVLHFWDYRSEPLVEPYGQVGYLDFLYNKRRSDGVQVYGVAVDGRLGREGERREALASIRKLRDFMNLSYPIALDGGEVLARFGDPQSVGAKLPLWVVVGRDGSVVHYSAGFYPINTDEGLKPLEQAVDSVAVD